ncbi:hypothetical protein ACGF7W_08655 [Streptomyces sp. NPDC048219]|uniref:hypothetical protein n=1 Tax=Streptomyces sp. NPDC048219 TaxID=3365517 RepID=UPI0037174F83
MGGAAPLPPSPPACPSPYTAPERFLDGDTLDSLSIAGGDGRTYLYADGDPDVCPAFRLRLQGG